MQDLIITIQKSAVMAEVAKTTAYVGAKTPGEAGANVTTAYSPQTTTK